MATRKHGDSRNQRLEKKEGQFSSWEFTVCERFCEKCNGWGEVRGLVNINFCPTCEIPFDKSWLEVCEKRNH